jgi:hypothetical protein
VRGSYIYLKTKPVCAACNLYLRQLAKKHKTFADTEAAGGYYDRLFTVPVDGPVFAAPKAPCKSILRCLGAQPARPSWSRRRSKATTGKEWVDFNKLDRRVSKPSGVDLAPVFRG